MAILEQMEHLEQEAVDFGFQWETKEQIMAQIRNECSEIEEHFHSPEQRADLQEEIGDLLHAVLSLCVFSKLDPELTLAKSLNKFERRLQAVKELVTEEGLTDLRGKDFEALMQYWTQAKVKTQLAQQNKPTKNRIKIDYLKHHSKHIPELAQIWYEVLGRIWVPEVPLFSVKANLKTHLNTEQLPITFLALDEERPVGMCSLRVNDGILPESTPWLGSLVVAKSHQKQGIGKQLIDKTKEKAQALGYKKLYLFAFDPLVFEYYTRLGWCKLGMEEFKGHPVTVMEIGL